jgi:hypothetical protein
MPDSLSSPIVRDGDASFIGLQSRRNPLTIKEGYLQVSQNMRLDRGIAQTRKGAKRLASGISVGATAVTLPFVLHNNNNVTSITQAGNVATVTTGSAHGLGSTASQFYVEIAGVTGATASIYNGKFTVTVTGANTFTYPVSGSPASNPPGTITWSWPVLLTNFSGGLFGAGIYSSPRYDYSNEYIVLCGPTSAYLYRQGATLLTLSYPVSPISEQILPGDIVNTLQAFDRLFLFRWRPSDLQNSVTSIAQGFSNLASAPLTYLSTAITATLASHGLIVGQQIKISGKTGTDAVLNGTWIVASVPSTSTFTFVIITGPTAALSNTVIQYATGTATITMPANHGYGAGEIVRLSGSDQGGFNLDALIATVPTTNTFTVTVPVGTAANTSASLFAQRVCCPLVWDGVATTFARVPTGTSPLGPSYSRMVSPTNGIAAYYNNQVVICNGRDTVLISDVLDPDTYDPMLKEFRTNTGSNDYLVALHPYANGQIIAFLRKSIFLGTIVIDPTDGVSVDVKQSTLQLLTSEVGCSARMTVATAGTYIYFLADQGVYRLDNSQIDLALRGNTLPLSEPVADLFASINQAAIGTANAVYFNNRYYLAVPTGSATSPNALIIYNQLNESWESVDTNLPALDRLVVSDYGTTRRLFGASNSGAIFLLEEYDSSNDDTGSGTAPAPVNGVITTRRYFYGQLSRKRLGNVAVSAVLPTGSTIDIAAVTTDPDNTTHVATVTNSGAENDYTVRAPMRRPGTYLDLTITTSGGRPTIRAVTADATIPADTSRLARTES